MKHMKGDGIPLVRRLLPKQDDTSIIPSSNKEGISLVSYLIQKSKHEKQRKIQK